jgi:hypothetical protein
MLLQMWMRERRKNTRALARLASPRRAGAGARARARANGVRTRRAREWSAPCGNAASFCRFVLPLRICSGYHTRNFRTSNRLDFWDAKNPSGSFLEIRMGAGYRRYRMHNAPHASACLLRHRVILHPVRRRAPAIGRAGLRNLVLSDPAPGEGE